MKVSRFLGEMAASTSSVYRIVFTGLLLWELIRFRFGKRRAHEEVHRPGPDFRGR